MKIRDKGDIQVRKPKWLKRRLPSGPEYGRMKNLIQTNSLATVCQEAQCPNQFECFSKGTATFMILGERCTRNCGFCAVSHKPLSLPDPEEPVRVADAVASLKLKYAVITSVTRDDLASLVYTSGTTGNPKGVMLSHGNLLFASGSVSESLPIEPHFETLLFLPLAHVFARLIVYVCVRNALPQKSDLFSALAPALFLFDACRCHCVSSSVSTRPR